MICVLLAAGYATRLYPLTKNFPKALLQVGGKTILDRILENVDRSCSVDRYVLVTNSRFAGIFRDWAESASYACPIEVLDDGTDTVENRRGAVGDLIFAMEEKSLDDDLFVMAVDYFVDFTLGDFVRYAIGKNASCILRYEEDDVSVLRKSGVMTVDVDDRIVRMEEKPEDPFDVWCAPPFYYYTKRDLPLIRTSVACGCPKDAPGNLAKWLAEQTAVYAMVMPGRHYDIGDLESYHDVQAQFS